MSKLTYYIRHSFYGATLWMAGDLMSQYYEGFEKRNKSKDRNYNNIDVKTEWDSRRLAVMTGYGFGAGSLYYYWYQKLDVIAPFVLKRLKLIPTPLRLSAAKLCIDLISFDPFFISLFFFSTSMLTGSTIEGFWNHYKTYFVPTYAVEALIWYLILI
eukprot:NODE_251_length_12882_cov_0.075334.p8 type:complete len:157 gc:universal NODE_251_length_12882_cov_0.075334:6840-7310(+)